MRYPAAALHILIFCSTSVAQVIPPAVYPKAYFRNPLAIPISLSGNFGELRPNHYHMGLDLKTGGKQNLPVYAAAEGYIARIKIEPAGFGRAIYINHPNGFTTLYAHLNDFFPALDNWIKQQQYLQESWKLQVDLPPGLFTVKKGEFIAYSGNTGGSQAPHLHFEIRRTADDVNVNPLLFGFPLADKIRPRVLRLAIYDRHKSVYEQSPRLIPVKAAGTGYLTSPATINVASPLISLAITALDKNNGAYNNNGIYESELYMDGQPMIAFRMDGISYNNTRYLNAHVDFRMKSAGGAWLQHLSELPGYISSIYNKVGSNGVLDLSDGEAHEIRIVVRDAYQNATTLSTKIKWTGKGGKPQDSNNKNQDPNNKNQEPNTQGPIPNSQSQIPSANPRMFYPMMLDGYESPDCEFYIGETCLYDSVHIRYSHSQAQGQPSALHAIGATYIPLQDPFLIRIKPSRSLNTGEKSRTIMQWYAGVKKDVQKVQWQGEWASARFRDFGYYRLLIDTVPPQIIPIGFTDGANLQKAGRILFTIKDDNDKFKNVRAELDGKWLRFTNDKGRTFIYRFDERCSTGSHVLRISAEDEAGNVSVREFKFIR